MLRILEKAGLDQKDVKLVELPSTGDVYATALASKQVDAAPLGGVQIKRYLAKYKADGGSTLRHGLRDDPSHLYSPAKSWTIRPKPRRSPPTSRCGAKPSAGWRTTRRSGSKGTTSRTRDCHVRTAST